MIIVYKAKRRVLEIEVIEQEEIEISLMRNTDQFEDPARLVDLSYDLDVVLAKVGKGCKTNKRCAEIIRLRYLSPEIFTQRDIAKKMGISTCRVGQLEDRAIRRLRTFSARMGLVTGRSLFLL